MSKHLSHGEYVDSTRRQVVETAQAMLDGRLSFLVGSRCLAALRNEVDVGGDDADFTTFEGIDSCTDALPLGEVRQYWNQDALVKLEPQIQSAEAWAASIGSAACRSLIARFAPSAGR